MIYIIVDTLLYVVLVAVLFEKVISDVDLGIQVDNTGDNISIKNPSCCELTAMYLVWKNLKDVDYIGLCHCRKIFYFES